MAGLSDVSVNGAAVFSFEPGANGTALKDMPRISILLIRASYYSPPGIVRTGECFNWRSATILALRENGICAGSAISTRLFCSGGKHEAGTTGGILAG